ncbi:MAG: type I 3-dehydroquinate dehydratase [Deltaproteobacteria bacterium RBG_13_53_10]|nr:MAG: type I 3-dehydroquinate dehydratase [Deltaproteobacteria bacterium RBG_13_53_10]
MRRLSSGKGWRKICVPIAERTLEKASRTIDEANSLADLIELRMDYLRNGGLGELIHRVEKPLIVTNRRKEEGGRHRGDEHGRLEVLKHAVDLGAEFIDIESGTERPLLTALIAKKKGTRVILSFHDFRGTPSQEELRRLCCRMAGVGADVLKIVTFARSREDNLLVLSLIPFARKRGQKIVAFCMGEKGRMSRVFAPWLGAAWTYAPLRRDRSSAPGQMAAGELREIWERLG